MTDIRFPVRPTLAGAVWPEKQSANARAMRAVLLALVGTGILILSAKIAVPVPPVPMTLQSLAVLLIGAVFGARLGAATVMLYLIEGALGLPVFTGTPAHGIGLAYMAGSTGGFLAGFVVAAALVGWFAERGADHSFARLLGAMVLGEIAIFGLGYVWLAHLIGSDAALNYGVLPFIPGDIVKTALAALLVPALWSVLAKAR